MSPADAASLAYHLAEIDAIRARYDRANRAHPSVRSRCSDNTPAREVAS